LLDSASFIAEFKALVERDMSYDSETKDRLEFCGDCLERAASAIGALIQPLWLKADPPITSAERWAERASALTTDGRAIDGNIPRDYLNGKTVRLQRKSAEPPAKALNILLLELPN